MMMVFRTRGDGTMIQVVVIVSVPILLLMHGRAVIIEISQVLLWFGDEVARILVETSHFDEMMGDR